MLQVKPDRIISDLRTLARFGGVSTGVNRLSFSLEDRQARAWLLEQMLAAGLDATIDGVGNVYGRSRGVSRAVLIGSHTDTVPNGGWLDGAMGVIFGLETARALRESPVAGDCGVDVISFADEEGTFMGLAGSRAFCGEISESDLSTARDLTGKSMPEAIREAGYDQFAWARLDLDRHVGYLEPHIEQGPRLEAAGKRIGIVTAIVGIRRAQVVFTGQADHAGTTPMEMRKDAGTALFQFAGGLGHRFREVSAADTVWNMGHVAFLPGAGNVVPKRAELLIECRDISPNVLDMMEREIQSYGKATAHSTHVQFEWNRIMALHPTQMDPGLREVLAQAAAKTGTEVLHMPSGAGHDAMMLSRYLPSAMLFIPSIGGRSHDVAEDSREEDIIQGARVLANAVATLIV